jgi:L-lactate dehydrogenase complex protein LldG
MSAREEILARIRTALADRPRPGPARRDYRGPAGPGDVERFIEHVTDYRATVHPAGEDVRATITRILTWREVPRVVVPDGFPDEWRPDISTVLKSVDIPTLDAVGAVLTTCRIGIAETGTIVLDAGPGMGPRALTLVPDYHLAVIRTDQIVVGVPDAIAALDPRRPLTWISGPSATSDIELDRVEGVHGPRILDVVLAR